MGVRCPSCGGDFFLRGEERYRSERQEAVPRRVAGQLLELMAEMESLEAAVYGLRPEGGAPRPPEGEEGGRLA